MLNSLTNDKKTHLGLSSELEQRNYLPGRMMGLRSGRSSLSGESQLMHRCDRQAYLQKAYGNRSEMSAKYCSGNEAGEVRSPVGWVKA